MKVMTFGEIENEFMRRSHNKLSSKRIDTFIEAMKHSYYGELHLDKFRVQWHYVDFGCLEVEFVSD